MSNHLHPGDCNGVGCHLCFLVETREDYRELWGIPPGVVTPKQKYCLHLGPFTGERRECPSCNGTVRLSVYSCGVHELCTLGKEVEGVACCKSCTDNTTI